ncbi:TIGR00730 family Rossman fold protein [Paremcibacter congregatus]|uniref:Cytokinin riboside 5'-monophosphate phosphoribohydrolase n=1 Tax=Paremcibacter congregatus TaxID=2043170 RepID=A0A2G4YM33_9PROT|nr:TIGR00730 family Rossman fold protein [Paremcibacter congregatus]PHZ83372.1 TIGR00730 family Rossman fold protein [Paremcibacter congregatus]QDE28158.1 TIGR00730 family Rossman fold protein [Paremcibacter congregatus]
MAHINSICVYCGSRPGRNGRFSKMAKEFGELLAAEKIRLVYGGGNVGLMGVIANSVMTAGGMVTGIIPQHLDEEEVGLKDATDFYVVDNMHDRKRMMFDHSDAFVALPGSIGTLDETIEVITWKQLQLHAKPIVIVNVDGYWDPLLTLIDNCITEEFTSPATRGLFHVVSSVTEVVPYLKSLPEINQETKNTLI